MHNQYRLEWFKKKYDLNIFPKENNLLALKFEIEKRMLQGIKILKIPIHPNAFMVCVR